MARIFISYSRQDKEIAQRIRATLSAAGFDTFLDTRNLPAGEEFHTLIRDEISRCDFFVFLASDSSTRPGSYALTELLFAESSWPNPSGIVLPVLLGESVRLPAYLSPIGAIPPQGAIEAEVLDWVQRLSVERGTRPHALSPMQLQLRRWARSSDPPGLLKYADLELPFLFATKAAIIAVFTHILIFILSIVIIFTLTRLISLIVNVPYLSSLFPKMRSLLQLFMETVTFLAVLAYVMPIYIVLNRMRRTYTNIWSAVLSLASLEPLAVVIINRSGLYGFIEFAVETANGWRVTGLHPISKSARFAYEGGHGLGLHPPRSFSPCCILVRVYTCS